MGEFNSSITRVVPVFENLMSIDRSRRSWLPSLLQMGSDVGRVQLPHDPGELIEVHPHWWGINERRLPAPLSLLEWLVMNISEEAVEKSGYLGEVLEKRRRLAKRDPKTQKEALECLRSGKRGRRWFVLEGESAPDAVLETDRILLVVEGKRTEFSTTTKTKWMKKRSQLIRHMDAASEVVAGRTVLGLLLVEGQDPDQMTVPTSWAAACAEQISHGLLDPSLPHRSPEQREQLRAGVLGAATWQRVCKTFGLLWPPKSI